eukprot:s156_g22.t1
MRLDDVIADEEVNPDGDQDATPESAPKNPKDPGSKQVSKTKANAGQAKAKAIPKPKVSKAAAKSKHKKTSKEETEKKAREPTDYSKAKKSFSEKRLDEHSFMK